MKRTDRLFKLCEKCIDEMRRNGYLVIPIEVTLPVIAQCEMCKVQKRNGHKACRICAVGSGRTKQALDRPVEKLVKSVAGDSAATFEP